MDEFFEFVMFCKFMEEREKEEDTQEQVSDISGSNYDLNDEVQFVDEYDWFE